MLDLVGALCLNGGNGCKSRRQDRDTKMFYTTHNYPCVKNIKTRLQMASFAVTKLNIYEKAPPVFQLKLSGTNHTKKTFT